MEIEFVEGRTFSRTASAGNYRVFIGDEDPKIDEVGIDELWLVEFVEFVRSDLLRVTPIRCLKPGESVEVDIEEYRHREIPPEKRHRGKETPDHLAEVLVKLPGLITVSFSWEDEKGVFGQYCGIVIRPADVPRVDAVWTKAAIGGTYLVAPKSSGRRGIYAEPLASVRRPSCADRVPSVFEARFKATDHWGVYAEFGGFLVRPDRTWDPLPQVGEMHRVWPVSVLRAGMRLIYVLPVGQCAPSSHLRAKNAAE